MKFANRVKETTATTGTGSLTLAGAVTGYQSFNDGFTDGDTLVACITDGTDWEVSKCTFTSPGTLARTDVEDSSNSGSLVNWSAGDKTVFAVMSASELPSGAFSKYGVEVADSPYTMPAWGGVYEIHNDTGEIELTLPLATSLDVGKEIKLWIEHNPANYKVIVNAPDTSHTINGVAADGVDVAKAEFNSSHENYFRVTIQCMAANEVYISSADAVYAAQRYVANFSATSDFSPYSYLSLSAIPTDFLTDNNDWWFGVKVESPMTNDSDGQVLFGSSNAFIAYRGNGTYFMTHSTSGYLMTVSPTTIVEAGEWILFRNDVSANTYTAWVNGTKVINATSSGTTMPTTAPTSMWFGSETGSTSGPSGYGYPLTECKISNICLGSGLLSDSDAALFTASTYTCPTLTGGTLTNQWTFDASDTITTVTGAINLSINGSNLGTEEL